MVICERGGFTAGEMPFWMTANVVFAPFYRDPGFYADAFGALGLTEISQVQVPLDMTFHVTAGVKA
jgi:hypothetical protein